MSETVINLGIRRNGKLIDPDEEPRLQAFDNSYGIRRVDTFANVVPNATKLTRTNVGAYRFVFQNPVEDPDNRSFYEYSLKLKFDGVESTYVRRFGQGTLNLGLLAISYDYFSSEAEVARIMGRFALELIMEDWDAYDQSPVWEDILSYADETILPYVTQSYNVPELRRNSYIRRRATMLACHQVSQRRGNPGLYLQQVNSIMEELEEIRKNRLHVPGAKPIGNLGPVVRNYTMQPYIYHPQRIQKLKSTGDSYAQEKIDWHPFLFTY